MKLTHLDNQGNARMVDISDKASSEREARAYGLVTMSRAAYQKVKTGTGPKGDILTVAKVAGIMGAKKTSELIPLCHPLALALIDISFKYKNKNAAIEIISKVKSRGPTGVEMEALSAAMLAALTIYDMCKAVDKGIMLGPFYLLEKSGGKSGTYRRTAG
jgi:cyclic pyranopterin phosphate synthase